MASFVKLAQIKIKNNISFMENIRTFQQHTPKIENAVYIDKTALIIGDVEIQTGSSVWPFVVARGDVNFIRIGKNTNIQDGSVLHVSQSGGVHEDGASLMIGDNVTVGHKVILHGCEIQHTSLIGMGSIILDKVVIEPYVFIGAGSLVPSNKRLESGYLYLGSPARKIRLLSDQERDSLVESAEHYRALSLQY